MSLINKYLFFEAPHKKQVTFLMVVVTALYFINFSVNDIFTPNESFYAEAVREMFESGNFLDIKYNYEPRYNKPPLTYWVIATSSSIFGLNEFGIRLPIVIMALGAVWYTYLLARKLYGDKAGVYALVIMAVSVQLIFVKQYASPEVPLTFFFTLTMYWFIKGYLDNEFKYILGAYITLGLTVLTKGFPYIIVIGGIIGLFLLIDSRFKWKEIWSKIVFLKLHLGIPIVLLIGISWVVFMVLKEGDAFWLVYKRETFGRALSKATRGPQPFFYLAVIAWSIAPYSIAFYYIFIQKLRNWAFIRQMAFAFSWIIVMLVIFTISKGKLPTYMIQAHPALILVLVPELVRYQTNNSFWRKLLDTTLYFPSLLLIIATAYVILEFDLSRLWMIVPVSVFTMLVYALIKRQKGASASLPFWSMIGFLIVFSAYLPKMEQLRPYDEIGEIVITDKRIDPKTPILLDGWLIHNIPFYTARKTERDIPVKAINMNEGQTLALIRTESMHQLEGFEELWSGYIYDFASESQFFKFTIAVNNAIKGDLSKFHKYHLIFRP